MSSSLAALRDDRIYAKLLKLQSLVHRSRCADQEHIPRFDLGDDICRQQSKSEAEARRAAVQRRCELIMKARHLRRCTGWSDAKLSEVRPQPRNHRVGKSL